MKIRGKRFSRLVPCCALLALVTAAAVQGNINVRQPAAPVYEKECGSCHVAFPPGLLPERSWRKMMENLRDHFGENAELKVSERDAILEYLVAYSAEKSASATSRSILATIRATETPERITRTAHIDGIHGGLLDPRFRGVPRVKSLSECAACHRDAARGGFSERRYTISDEDFRRPP